MTLEDFFTLTEMKNGLATLARVEELISMMQQQKDCVMSNLGDTARQWSSVANTLAATENKDCLNHFVQSNGLFFLNQWLQEALKCSNDFTDSSVEELMNALLGSLERLPINREKLIASGIQITVEQLHGYKSLNINERARILSERWNHPKVNDDSYQDLKKAGTCEDDNPKPSADADTVDDAHLTYAVCDISPCIGGTDEGNCKVESAGIESHHSNVTICPDSSRLNSADDGKTSTSNLIMATACLNSADANANLGDTNTLPSSLVSNSSQENFSRTEESSFCPAVGMTSTRTCYSPNARSDIDDHCNASVFKDVDDAKEMQMEVDTKEGSPCKPDKKESRKVSSSSGLSASSVERKPERSVSYNFDSKENKACISETIEPLPRSASVDCVLPKYLRTMELKPVKQDLLDNGCKLRKIDDPETSFHRNKDVGSVSEVKELGSESKLDVSNGVDTVIPHDSSKTVEMKLNGEMEQRSELGLEDGEIDALEVARQVAIEVEREVVDYREPFCSSSPEVNSGEIMGTQGSDILEEDKKDQPVNKELNGSESVAGKNLSDGASSPKGVNSRTSETDIDPDKCEQNVEMPKPTTVAQESGGKTDRDKCVDFDLNEDVCTEEFGRLMDPIPNSSFSVSVPIAVVAASKGAPLLPVTPLHFEGEQGWKGSAATSAFRPASTRRTPEAGKTYSGAKRKANFIEIDLNVAESGDDAAIDPISTKPIPVSSGFPFRDSSIEVISGRTDRLKLDLNRLGDEDVSPYPSSSYQRLPHQNGDQTVSPASSSSSRQPSMRDFDLNDNPCFFDAIGSHDLNKSSPKDSGWYGSSRRGDPIITIMGSRMAMEKKDNAHQAQHSFMGNGLSIESTMAVRPVQPYAHIPPPAYGYNGLTVGPAVPFPPSPYGPGNIPYMVDSRGSTVVPQILGPLGVNGAPSAVPPFFMSATNAPSSLNGAGQSLSGVDLNSGMMSMEIGNREAGSIKHLFMQGHNGFMEEQARTVSQPTASGVSLKQKEHDSGWEPYAFGYKQVTSWQ